MASSELYYILVGETPIAARDMEEWGRWMRTDERFLWQTEVGQLRVDTVFLGLDHGFRSDIPVLFETMIFGEHDHADWQWRWRSYQEAKWAHKEICINLAMNKPPW